MLRYVDMVRRSLAEKVWLPPRGLRAALLRGPPQWRRRASWFRGPGPPPPLVRFAPSLLGPALFWSGGVVARGLGVFRPCGGGWGPRPPGPRRTGETIVLSA